MRKSADHRTGLPASSRTKTEQYRGAIRRDAADVLKKLDAARRKAAPRRSQHFIYISITPFVEALKNIRNKRQLTSLLHHVAYRWFDVDGDVPPFSLPEAQHAQQRAREMTENDREPDVAGL